MAAAWPWGLLVSVRDAEEAATAVAAGAAIIDVKEPRNGPLGRAAVEIVAAVAAATGRHAPLTLACGELAAGDEIPAHVADVLGRLGPATPPPKAVKAGPAGLSLAAWCTAFGRLRENLPPGIEAVAVAYADWRRAESPPPDAVFAEAFRMNATALLVDTFDKRGPGLLTTIPSRTVAAWALAAAAAGIPLAVAGRMTPVEVAEAFGLGAGIVGVRSAACDGGRDGRITAPRVRQLVTLSTSKAATERPTPHGVQLS